MATSFKARPRRSGRFLNVAKPSGALHPRVQRVGPEHFGVVAVDCAKARSKWMLADFYGRILLPPRVVEHRRDAFDDALAALGQARRTHQLRDVVVAVERTGRYHLPVVRAYAAAGHDTRIVHPSVSRHFRQAAAYDTKTDDTDLGGIFLAAIHGFGLQEPAWDPLYRRLQLWARHRRDLVRKESLLRCQILERLDA